MTVFAYVLVSGGVVMLAAIVAYAIHGSRELQRAKAKAGRFLITETPGARLSRESMEARIRNSR